MPDTIINVYCDESCHLENDGFRSMVLGAVYCNADKTKDLSRKFRDLKRKHGLAPEFETKWTKISPAKQSFYSDLIDLFANEADLRFRGVLIPDKSVLDHRIFDQSHDDWYYKMYYLMLRQLLLPNSSYHIYLDIKDTRGADKTRQLHTVLCNDIRDFDCSVVRRVQQVRSHESELLQIADLLIGAIAYESRNLTGSRAKVAVIDRIKARFGHTAISRTSSVTSRKFNLLVWRPKEDGQ